jgi:hypothetical protein
VERVELLGGGPLPFRTGANALRVSLPRAGEGTFVPVLRIAGSAIGAEAHP